MQKITFKWQVCIGLVILGLCLLLARLLENNLFISIAWIAYGLLFLLNPVWPKAWNYADPDKMKQNVRISGIFAIVIGIMTLIRS